MRRADRGGICPPPADLRPTSKKWSVWTWATRAPRRVTTLRSGAVSMPKLRSASLTIQYPASRRSPETISSRAAVAFARESALPSETSVVLPSWRRAGHGGCAVMTPTPASLNPPQHRPPAPSNRTTTRPRSDCRASTAPADRAPPLTDMPSNTSSPAGTCSAVQRPRPSGPWSPPRTRRRSASSDAGSQPAPAAKASSSARPPSAGEPALGVP